jgi:hypothetical protein
MERPLPQPESLLTKMGLIRRRSEKEGAQMNEGDSGPRNRPLKRNLRLNSGRKIRRHLGGEDQLLHLISSRAALPEILNRICSALDCQIGNVVSLISLPGNDASELAAMASNAALFGLHTFCSVAIVDEKGELVGSLETYCCVPQSPSASEVQLIEWAKCLAAFAIKLHNDANQQSNRKIRTERPVRWNVIESPVCVN